MSPGPWRGVAIEVAIRLLNIGSCELLKRVADAPKTGLRADKAFFDDLSGDA